MDEEVREWMKRKAQEVSAGGTVLGPTAEPQEPQEPQEF